jgi:hypothetical protein
MSREQLLEETILRLIVDLSRIRKYLDRIDFDGHWEELDQIEAGLDHAMDQTRSLLLMTRPHKEWEQA